MAIGNLITDVSPGPSLGNAVARKTFTGGAAGAHTLFTVTGTVLVRLAAVCTENLAGATATLEVGIAASTAAIIAQTTATDIDDGDIWHDASPDSELESVSTLAEYIISDSNNIIATVATATISDGTIEFYCFWEALSADGNVVAT
jgi:hypothetical protein